MLINNKQYFSKPVKLIILKEQEPTLNFFRYPLLCYKYGDLLNTVNVEEIKGNFIVEAHHNNILVRSGNKYELAKNINTYRLTSSNSIVLVHEGIEHSVLKQDNLKKISKIKIYTRERNTKLENWFQGVLINTDLRFSSNCVILEYLIKTGQIQINSFVNTLLNTVKINTTGTSYNFYYFIDILNQVLRR